MKSFYSFLTAAVTAVFVLALAPATRAQSDLEDERVEFSRRNLGGPRLGMTYVTPGSELSRRLKDEKMGNALSQFGWHFEYQIIPRGGGPQFVIEFVPLVGGVEYGKFIPGATLAMGVRFPSGIEFGLGPNATATPRGVSSTALVIAGGKTFNYGGVSIPLNLAYITNPDGGRIAFILGYAVAKRVRR
jgi:hypothetical protein